MANGNNSHRRLVDMSAPEHEEDFLSQFDPDELTEERIDFDLGPDARCIQRMLDWKNQVVWFAIMIEVFRDGRWWQVARADTCHDETHVHYFVRGQRAEVSRQQLQQVTTIGDVQDGFDHACDLLTDDWESNVRRWDGG